MASDPSSPDSERPKGLSLVDESSDDAAASEPFPDADAEASEPFWRRRLPVWLLLLVGVLFAVLVVSQLRRAGQLEAEIVGLEGRLATTTARLEETTRDLEAHRSHLGEIRGGVQDLSARLAGLRALVLRDPTLPVERASDRSESPAESRPATDGRPAGSVVGVP